MCDLEDIVGEDETCRRLFIQAEPPKQQKEPHPQKCCSWSEFICSRIKRPRDGDVTLELFRVRKLGGSKQFVDSTFVCRNKKVCCLQMTSIRGETYFVTGDWYERQNTKKKSGRWVTGIHPCLQVQACQEGERG